MAKALSLKSFSTSQWVLGNCTELEMMRKGKLIFGISHNGKVFCSSIWFYSNGTKPEFISSFAFWKFLLEVLGSVTIFAWELTIAQVDCAEVDSGGNIAHPSSTRKKTTEPSSFLRDQNSVAALSLQGQPCESKWVALAIIVILTSLDSISSRPCFQSHQ